MESADEDFQKRLEAEGIEPELIKLGLRVADNYSRTREEALRIAERYVREMSK